MSIYGFEGIKALLEEVDDLVEKGWILDRREVEWGVAYLYRRVEKFNKQGIGGSLHDEVPSFTPVRSTGSHALSRPSSGLEEQLFNDGELNRKLSTLTTEERQVLLLQAKHYRESREVKVPVDHMASLLDEGWYVQKQENGIATMSGDFAPAMTHEQIAAVMGLTPRQVRRRIAEANKKLRQR